MKRLDVPALAAHLVATSPSMAAFLSEFAALRDRLERLTPEQRARALELSRTTTLNLSQSIDRALLEGLHGDC